ncbi:MAG: DJ-1/PfpI family protein [bacterium]
MLDRVVFSLLLFAVCLFGQPVAVFIPQQLFRDDEFEAVVRLIERAKIPVVTVASDTGVAQGIDGLFVKPQRRLRDITPEEFSALVLIDGSGAAVYWQDSVLFNRCRQFAGAGRVVAAIELAPITLAYAGVLSGKSATAFPDYHCIKILKENGCRHRFSSVVRDGNIITAAKAEHSAAFARTILKALRQR